MFVFECSEMVKVVLCLSRYLHSTVSFPATVWSLRKGHFPVSGYDRFYFLQT